MNAADRRREVNAVVFFAQGVPDCPAKKLFKLLYLADVASFREAGRGVTTLQYAAGDFGPYPTTLSCELRELLSPDLASVISVEVVRADGDHHIIRVVDGVAPCLDDFTRRQITILREVSAMFALVDHAAIDVSPFDNGAWRKALARKKHDVIKMEESVEDQAANREAVLEQAEHYRGRAARLRELHA